MTTKLYLTCTPCGMEVPLPDVLPEGMDKCLVTLTCPACGHESRDYAHELTITKKKGRNEPHR